MVTDGWTDAGNDTNRSPELASGKNSTWTGLSPKSNSLARAIRSVIHRVVRLHNSDARPLFTIWLGASENIYWWLVIACTTVFLAETFVIEWLSRDKRRVLYPALMDLILRPVFCVVHAPIYWPDDLYGHSIIVRFMTAIQSYCPESYTCL